MKMISILIAIVGMSQIAWGSQLSCEDMILTKSVFEFNSQVTGNRLDKSTLEIESEEGAQVKYVALVNGPSGLYYVEISARKVLGTCTDIKFVFPDLEE